MGRTTKTSLTTKNIMDYRSEIFGISMVLIVIYHLTRQTWMPLIYSRMESNIFYFYLKNFIQNFRIGVDAFLFLSALGLYHSMNKNSTTTFYLNRIKRVVVPCLIMFIPFYIYIDFFYRQKDFLWYIFDVTTISYWIPKVPYSFWYIAFIIIIYALYPWLYKLDKKTKHISTYVLLGLSIIGTLLINFFPTPYLMQIETALSRLPVFFLGMALCPVFSKEYKIPWWILLISFVLWCVSLWLLVLFGCNELFRLLGSAFAVLSIILFSWLMKVGGNFMYKLNTPFRFIGKYTLEIYILHLVLYNIVQINLSWEIIKGERILKVFTNGLIWIIILLLLSIVLAMLVQKLTKIITKGRKKNVTMH